MRPAFLFDFHLNIYTKGNLVNQFSNMFWTFQANCNLKTISVKLALITFSRTGENCYCQPIHSDRPTYIYIRS